MAEVELVMPKMGESIIEATILKWVKNVGDSFEMDETILEIATDKVDSEVPASEAGTLTKILFQEGDVVEVGKVIAIYETNATNVQAKPQVEIEETSPTAEPDTISSFETVAEEISPQPVPLENPVAFVPEKAYSNGVRFYSPLVLNIAKNEGISMEVLESIPGSGKNGRVTKKDILAFVNKNGKAQAIAKPAVANVVAKPNPKPNPKPAAKPSSNGEVEIIEMDRMRKLIADHMVRSVQTSPHVTSFVEADVTKIVNWRNKVKAKFLKEYGQKITYTPIFMQAVIKAIRDFPGVNASVDGNKILLKKFINLGMATALPSGNLIVPVIKNADEYNLLGLTKKVNDLAGRARRNELKPSEIEGGTYTVTNVGTFGNVMGTPIINQPQVAILALGAIRKKPAIIETEKGDTIGIRHMMFMSHSYDHRVVDGYLGGSFVRRVADYLEDFDENTSI